MLNNDVLSVGMVVRSGGELYRVQYVNACRALLIPLAKVHVVLPNGREFDASERGISISPRAAVEIVSQSEGAA